MIGIGSFFLAQIWALALIAPHEERIGPRDLLVLSSRLWGVIVRRLPETRWPLWLACWGLALIAADFWLIGGLTREVRLAITGVQRRVAEVRSEIFAGSRSGSSGRSESPQSEGPGLAATADVALCTVAGTAGWLAGKWYQWRTPAAPANPPLPGPSGSG
jgi:hypothetical protein